jgi:AraC-like DNA-binding protein
MVHPKMDMSQPALQNSASHDPIITEPVATPIPPAPMSSVRLVSGQDISSDDFLARARSAIVLRLADGTSTVEQVAKALHVSTRTLQRRLHERNSSVSRLLDDVRQEVVMLMLASGAPMRTIAEQSGFGDVPAFYRAFRRWTGTTPGKYKRGSNATSLIVGDPGIPASPALPADLDPQLSVGT